MATTPTRYTPQFTHDPWLDNVHRVQAAGDNGFNRRFYALQEEFGRIKSVMDNLALVASELQAAVSALQAQMGGAVVDLSLTGKLGVGTTAPVSRVQIKSLTALDEGASEAGAWANIGSNEYYDGAWKRIDPTKAGVNFHFNADGAGHEFRFSRIEADGTNARDIAAIGTTKSFIAEGNVGIGTTEPTVKLDVNGDVRITNGKLTIPDNTLGLLKLRQRVHPGAYSVTAGVDPVFLELDTQPRFWLVQVQVTEPLAQRVGDADWWFGSRWKGEVGTERQLVYGIFLRSPSGGSKHFSVFVRTLFDT